MDPSRSRVAHVSPKEQRLGRARSYSDIMRMKPLGNGVELSLVAAGLLVVMLLMMWIQRPAATCTLSVEGARVLVLSRETDREHLTTDLASAARAARRYMLSIGDIDRQQIRRVECEATLDREIATRHGLSSDQVRTHRIDASPLPQ
jgi:hypothetical protein